MAEVGRTSASARDELPTVLTSLFKGPVYRDEREQLWRNLLQLRRQVEDYVETIGLMPVIDEIKGYAFLRSRDDDPNIDAPRLIPRRELSYPVSLLLALLRRRLAELDASSSEVRLILDRDDMVTMMQTFLPAGANEARIIDQIDAHIRKARELGFLRELPNSGGKYEVRRILEAFVDGQWLADFDRRLQQYAQTVRADVEASAE